MAADGRLTTHGLDTAAERPARGLVIELYRVEASGRRHLLSPFGYTTCRGS